MLAGGAVGSSPGGCVGDGFPGGCDGSPGVGLSVGSSGGLVGGLGGSLGWPLGDAALAGVNVMAVTVGTVQAAVPTATPRLSICRRLSPPAISLCGIFGPISKYARPPCVLSIITAYDAICRVEPGGPIGLPLGFAA